MENTTLEITFEEQDYIEEIYSNLEEALARKEELEVRGYEVVIK